MIWKFLHSADQHLLALAFGEFRRIDQHERFLRNTALSSERLPVFRNRLSKPREVHTHAGNMYDLPAQRVPFRKRIVPLVHDHQQVRFGGGQLFGGQQDALFHTLCLIVKEISMDCIHHQRAAF